MKIGQVSAASGCQIETIRYYERIGLLKAPARTEAGYRHYTEDDIDRLRFVTRGRALGFSLDEIASLLRLAQDQGLSCDDVDRLARAHLADVQRFLRRAGDPYETLKRARPSSEPRVIEARARVWMAIGRHDT